MIYGIDPGAKPGYCLADPTRLIPRGVLTGDIPTPRVMRLSRTSLSTEGVTTIVVEGQWIHGTNAPSTGRRMASPSSVLTLAFTAGRQCERAALGAPRAAVYRMPPDGKDSWFGAFYRSRGVPQDVLVNRIRTQLDPAELRALEEGAGRSRLAQRDLLAAIGLAWAIWLVPDPEIYRIQSPA